jgi:hypothetical protein
MHEIEEHNPDLAGGPAEGLCGDRQRHDRVAAAPHQQLHKARAN